MVRRLRFLVVLCLLVFAASTSTAIAAAIDVSPPMPLISCAAPAGRVVRACVGRATEHGWFEMGAADRTYRGNRRPAENEIPAGHPCIQRRWEVRDGFASSSEGPCKREFGATAALSYANPRPVTDQYLKATWFDYDPPSTFTTALELVATKPGGGNSGKDGIDRTKPGDYAGHGTPSSDPNGVTAGEQAGVNAEGAAGGCHSCGSRDPGTKSGNFVGDHQPPTALNPPGEAQKLYPHCLSCSRKQGGQVRAGQSKR